MSTMNIRLSDYFQELTRNFLGKRKDQESFRLLLKHQKTTRLAVVEPLLRYTERYMNRFYYQFQELLKLKASYFVTLTFPINSAWSSENYEKHINTVWRDKWKKSASWLRKYLAPSGGNNYFRTFELTKKNTLHVHIVFFNNGKMYQPIMEKFAEYYHKNHGFIDLKRFEYQNVYCHTYKYWINCDRKKCNHLTPINHWDFYKLNMLPEHKDDDGVKYTKQHLVSNYVIKYQMKEPTDTHKAIFTKFKIRTYGMTRSLSKFKRKIVSSGDWKVLDQGHINHNQPEVEMHMRYLDNVLLDLKNTQTETKNTFLKKYRTILLPGVKKYTKNLKNTCNCFPFKNSEQQPIHYITCNSQK